MNRHEPEMSPLMLAKMRPGHRLAVVLIAPLSALLLTVAVMVVDGGLDAVLQGVIVGVAAVATLVAVVVGARVSRSLAEPVRRLAGDAERVAADQLPAFLAQLREGAVDVGRPSPVQVPASPDLARVASAFNVVQDITLDVADEQAVLLRKGISELFVNLARRNQALLDKQIEFIDELEANERDPEQLEHLFRLDHLATRMRRNAESLLVLADAEPPRRRGRPVPLAEVLRVAVGEVADYGRLEVHDSGSVTIVAEAAVDLAHLLAELMDNATQYSAPDTVVEVRGEVTLPGDHLLTLSDQGIGMGPDQLAEANRVLADPPVAGLQLGRSLGFVVVGRLARRHGITVRLEGTPGAGVTAMVTVPVALVGEEEPPAVPVPSVPVGPATDPPVPALSGEPTVTVIGALAGAGAALDMPDGMAIGPPAPVTPIRPVPTLLVPSRGPLDVTDDEQTDRSLAPAEVTAPSPVVTAVSVPAPAGAVSVPAAPLPPPPTVPAPTTESAAVIEPATTDGPGPSTGSGAGPDPIESALPSRPSAGLTGAGLARRSPKQQLRALTRGEEPAPGVARPAPAQRSPEEVRQMLSRYRSGLHRGRASTSAVGDGETPGASGPAVAPLPPPPPPPPPPLPPMPAPTATPAPGEAR